MYPTDQMANLQAPHHVHANLRNLGLIHHTKERDHVRILLLRDELHEDTHVVQPSLTVRQAHDAVQEVDLTLLPRVVEAVLRAGQGVQVEVDAKAVLARPLERLQSVLPRDALEERLFPVLLDGPERDRKANPVETCGGDASKVLLGLKGFGRR